MSQRCQKIGRAGVRWALWAIITVCLLGIVNDTALGYLRGVAGGGGLYVPDTVFLNARRGSLVTASGTLRVYNLRSRRLTLRLERSCGCDKTPWDTATIAPFCWAVLPVRVQMDGDEPLAQKTVEVDTDYPARRYLPLSFRNTDR